MFKYLIKNADEFQAWLIETGRHTCSLSEPEHFPCVLVFFRGREFDYYELVYQEDFTQE